MGVLNQPLLGGKTMKETKSARLVGLFLAAALAVSSGCSFSQPRYSQQPEHTHVDADKDGYCDFDGRPMDESSSGSFAPRYYGVPYYGHTYSTGGYSGAVNKAPAGKAPAAGVSSGAKGGIGTSFGVSG